MFNYCALSSIVYMMGFVFLFDGLHQRNRFTRLLRSISLCTPEEVSRVQAIWAACQDS